MGQVYQVTDIKLNRQVALKTGLSNPRAIPHLRPYEKKANPV